MLSVLYVVVVFVITENIRSVSGCSCLPQSDEQIYCNAEWVSLVFVHAKHVQKNELLNLPIGELNYTVFHSWPLKLPQNVGKLPETILTHDDSTVCGVDHLEEHEFYVLAGTYNPERNVLFIVSCGQFHEGKDEKWENLSPKTKQSLIQSSFKCKQ